ncbi:MAG TPA: RodZ domain-containing protein [Sulfuricella sp.]|nr:RodZ domain-containing protein [Sulfuricella sp.]
MTEEIDNGAVEPQEEAKVDAGRLLAEARERSGLTVADVARQLRLSTRQIEALEANDHASLPGDTFRRGFIRNYAKLLQIDPEPLLESHQWAQPQTQAIAVPIGRVEFGGRHRLMPFGGNSSRMSSPKFAIVIGVAVLALFLGAYELLQGRPTNLETPAKSGGETTMALSLPQSRPQNEVAPHKAPVENQNVVPKVPSPAPATEVAPSSSAAPAASTAVAADAGGQRLQFVFDGDSWVEVKDKSGKVIFYQLNPKGSQQSVRGTPPFSLVVGNAPSVRLSYNGKSVDLAPHTKVDVARLTLE